VKRCIEIPFAVVRATYVGMPRPPLRGEVRRRWARILNACCTLTFPPARRASGADHARGAHLRSRVVPATTPLTTGGGSRFASNSKTAAKRAIEELEEARAPTSARGRPLRASRTTCGRRRVLRFPKRTALLLATPEKTCEFRLPSAPRNRSAKCGSLFSQAAGCDRDVPERVLRASRRPSAHPTRLIEVSAGFAGGRSEAERVARATPRAASVKGSISKRGHRRIQGIRRAEGSLASVRRRGWTRAARILCTQRRPALARRDRTYRLDLSLRQHLPASGEAEIEGSPGGTTDAQLAERARPSPTGAFYPPEQLAGWAHRYEALEKDGRTTATSRKPRAPRRPARRCPSWGH